MSDQDREQHIHRVQLIGYALECEVAWETQGFFVPAPPRLTLQPHGEHTLRISALLQPKDLRALAAKLVEAADDYDACRDAEDRHIAQLKVRT